MPTTSLETAATGAETTSPWPAYRSHKAHLAAVEKQFTADTAGHRLTVMHDVDGYRHVRMANPARSEYWYDVITTPGYGGRPGTLSITGDMGTYVFARVDDMFTFFRGNSINPDYWAQKLQIDGRERAYSRDAFVEQVVFQFEESGDEYTPEELADLIEAVKSRVLDDCESEEDARAALDSFIHGDFVFYDTWEWDLTEFTYHFLWCCHAIVAAIAAYDAASAEEPAPPQ